MTITLGTCPCSWGIWFPEDARQMPYARFLDEAASVGYEWVELGPYGYLPKDIDALREELHRRRLNVSGSFLMTHLEEKDAWPALAGMVHQVGERLHRLGAGYLVLIDELYSDALTGEPRREARLDGDAWKRLVDHTQRVAQLAQEQYGLVTVFHPHAETHVEEEEQVERLLEQTDPAYVSLCLDTGHWMYRGGHPIDLLRRHHRRIKYIHLKSVDAAIHRRVTAERIPFAPAVMQGVFCEPSRGTLDVPALIHALQEVDFTGFVVVEQDMYGVPFDTPLPIAERTYRYIRGWMSGPEPSPADRKGRENIPWKR